MPIILFILVGCVVVLAAKLANILWKQVAPLGKLVTWAFHHELFVGGVALLGVLFVIAATLAYDRAERCLERVRLVREAQLQLAREQAEHDRKAAEVAQRFGEARRQLQQLQVRTRQAVADAVLDARQPGANDGWPL